MKKMIIIKINKNYFHVMKSVILDFARFFGLAKVLDTLRFTYFYLKNYSKNKAFSKEHPGLKLPPDYIMYESFKLDYEKYYCGGADSAKWVCDILEKYLSLNGIKILDWGCGPARITRHLPSLISNGEVYGTDYNGNSIQWNLENITNVRFFYNEIDKPLDFNSESFDAIIGISIFTHLSEENHYFWIKELHRILKDGGIAFLTTAGDDFREIMSAEEKQIYNSGTLVVRGKTKEGHRTYVAFQPVNFFNTLVNNYFKVLKFKKGEKQSWGIAQDYWVLQKMPSNLN